MSKHLNTIPSNSIAKIVKTFRTSKRVPAFMGPPGIGKTQQVREAANEISQETGKYCHVVELHLAQLAEVDVRGYLIPKGDDAVFTAPVFWREVCAHEQGILFLDEFMQACSEVQKAVAPLLLDGRIGDYKLPDGWSIVVAGNGQDDLSGAGAILAHIVNRLSLFRVTAPEPDDWVSWALDRGIDPILIAFAKSSPSEVFHAEIPTTGDTPYCSPRSIEALNDISQCWPGGLGAMSHNPEGLATIAATVGSGAASILCSLIDMAHSLPDYSEVIAAPDTTPVPSKLAHAYAAILMLCARAKLEDATDLLVYISRFNENHAVVGLRMLLAKHREFAHTPALLKWVSEHRETISQYRDYFNNKA